MVKKKFATHVFVLDTLCDTSDAREGAEMAEPQPDCSVGAQLAAMKLICCAGMPEKVAVVLMGGTPAEVRLGLPATEAWRVRAGRGSEPDSESILRGYEALPSPPEPELQQEAMQESTTRAERSDTGDASNEEEADRIVAALKASVEAVTSRHWTELDLFEQEEKARITVFLGSPPKDLSKSRDVLLGLKDKMAAVGVSLHFILDPRAYDKKRQVFNECFFSPCCGWTEERPSPTDNLRCSQADLNLLGQVMGYNFGRSVPSQGFLETCCTYNSVHLSGCKEQGDVLEQWKECYGDEGEDFPSVFWKYGWVPTRYDEDEDE